MNETLAMVAGSATIDPAADLASGHMRCGLALMDGRRDQASVAAALAHFDAALALRRGLPCDDVHASYARAACWMNRAEALLHLGGVANIALAVESLDAAVRTLEAVPLVDVPLVRRRLAIALQNRATARGRLGHDTWTMVPDLFRALDLLAPLSGDEDARLAATMWLNIGVAQLLEPTEDAWRGAIVSARQALRVAEGCERSNAQMATLGLHARHLIGQAAARCLETAGGRTVTADVHVATDTVDEALALVATWEERGLTAFRGVAADLFRLGRRVYAIYQPHFVAEFERDYIELYDVCGRHSV